MDKKPHRLKILRQHFFFAHWISYLSCTRNRYSFFLYSFFSISGGSIRLAQASGLLKEVSVPSGPIQSTVGQNVVVLKHLIIDFPTS